MIEFQLVHYDYSSEENGFLQRAIELFRGAQISYAVKEADVPLTTQSRSVDWTMAREQLKKRWPSQHVVAITSKPLSDNWFSHSDGMVTLISTSGWQEFYSPPGLPCFLMCEFIIAAYFQTIRLHDLKPSPHEQPCGCLLDLCEMKTDVQWKMRCGFLCDEHRGAFRTLGGTDEQLTAITAALNALRREAIGAPTVDSRHATTCGRFRHYRPSIRTRCIQASTCTKGGLVQTATIVGG